MARKPQIKTINENTLASPDQENNKLVHAALFKVGAAGNIESKHEYAPFLLNPESIEDTKSGNWVENTIPGQSDPILQWVSGGARTLSFTALVTRDTFHFPSKSKNLLGGMVDSAINAVGAIASSFAGVNIPPIGDVLGSLLGNSSPSVGEKELSIANSLDYYRSLMYPTINDANVLQSSPPLVVLAMGKTLSSFSGKSVTGAISPKSTDLWITKNVNIRVTKWLPNLTPMEAEVSFEFVQYIISSRGQADLLPNTPEGATGDISTGIDIGSFV